MVEYRRWEMTNRKNDTTRNANNKRPLVLGPSDPGYLPNKAGRVRTTEPQQESMKTCVRGKKEDPNLYLTKKWQAWCQEGWGYNDVVCPTVQYAPYNTEAKFPYGIGPDFLGGRYSPTRYFELANVTVEDARSMLLMTHCHKHFAMLKIVMREDIINSGLTERNLSNPQATDHERMNHYVKWHALVTGVAESTLLPLVVWHELNDGPYSTSAPGIAAQNCGFFMERLWTRKRRCYYFSIDVLLYHELNGIKKMWAELYQETEHLKRTNPNWQYHGDERVDDWLEQDEEADTADEFQDALTQQPPSLE
ncbi:hypothetical protein BJ508DRAFT_337124 [Ascobolus immersus RN42]|uniref:Uncharacterized protein n=1 Tax=Ascobolus immersus RN42 TaxID=1160509 RepID=A0A3N4H8Z8_ASCIM|nr:hypothetical protein BJ508DRAFT_337124 [Ascobolus immersus RN42]